jgi:hypothetical protein
MAKSIALSALCIATLAVPAWGQLSHESIVDSRLASYEAYSGNWEGEAPAEPSLWDIVVAGQEPCIPAGQGILGSQFLGQSAYLYESSLLEQPEFVIRAQDSGGSGGGGDLSSQATNPTSNLTVYQVQNTFVPSTYEASGFAYILGLQAVKPFETRSCFFPTWITRTTLPVISSADPDANVPIGPPNGGDFAIPLGPESGLGDLVFISILNHPTCWGSWGIGPGFVAPSATRRELGEQSWKFSPTFAVIHTAIPTWQFGMLGVYNFPLDGKGTQSLQFQPLIVKQLGQGWYTGWGDDLWQFNTETGNFDMPLQLRLGKVLKLCRHSYNVFVTGAYTPDELRKGPAPEWGIKLSVSVLIPGGS